MHEIMITVELLFLLLGLQQLLFSLSTDLLIIFLINWFLFDLLVHKKTYLIDYQQTVGILAWKNYWNY